VLAGTAGAQEPAAGNNPAMEAGKARVIDHWSSDRRQAASPRDLVIDPRGLGYLRRQDGSLEPYGHQITAESTSSRDPRARPPSSSDSTPPVIANMDPGAGSTIGTSATFAATVSDAESGVRSVAFIVTYPDGVTTQTFSASPGPGDVWSVDLQGFTNGSWSWSVEARDNAKRGGNRSVSASVAFTVDSGGGTGGGGTGGGTGGGSDTVTNGVWNFGGDIETAAGRIYFEMPNNARRKRWNGYVCSGTVVTDAMTGRSIILTAAHCVYDDANKAFARNVLFIPDQAATTGAGTDTNCNNDPLGCWVPSIGIVDDDWTIRTFPDNIPWDYAFYVVEDAGAHAGSTASEQLDAAVATLAIDFSMPNHDDSTPGASSGDFTHALGYSYSEDPKFMYCAEDMTTEGAANWWLPSCGLSGGSSGGAWVQPMSSAGSGPIISVNSWGYTTQPGMAGPRLDASSASCVFDAAKTEYLNADGYPAGDAGRAVNCN
jgi:hypothetical protein